MILQRISFIDACGFLIHEWMPTPMTAMDRMLQLEHAGMQSIDCEEIDVPWENPSDLIYFLNNTPNNPNLKDDPVMVSPEMAMPGTPRQFHTTPSPSSALEVQIAGDHYKKLQIQPVEYIHANSLPFIEGNVVKYITRWRAKGGVKDLEKAKHFIDLLIELENRKQKE